MYAYGYYNTLQFNFTKHKYEFGTFEVLQSRKTDIYSILYVLCISITPTQIMCL